MARCAGKPESSQCPGSRADVAADMTALPFPDGSFDVVTSALTIHNIPPPEGRYRAVDEATRYLLRDEGGTGTDQPAVTSKRVSPCR